MIKLEIVSTPKPHRFKEQVEGYLNDGWVMSGTPFISDIGVITVALTKETKTVPKKASNAKVQE